MEMNQMSNVQSTSTSTSNHKEQSMQITLTLTAEQVAEINILLETSQSDTFEAEVTKCLRYGIENRVYRQGFNKRQNQKRKEEAAELDRLRALLASR